MASELRAGWLIALAVMAGSLAVAGGLAVRRERALAAEGPAYVPAPSEEYALVFAEMAIDEKRLLRESLGAGREAEARRIAATPGLARREGDVLFIRHDWRDVASFADDANLCEGFDNCSRWRFLGELALGPHRYPYVSFFHGEGDEITLLVDGRGELVVLGQGFPSASPDGRWLVMAGHDDYGSNLSVFAVGPDGLKFVASSEEACQPARWLAHDRLEMVCEFQAGESARAMLVHDRGWRLDAPPDAPRPVPAVKSEADDGVGYFGRKGYRRLAR